MTIFIVKTRFDESLPSVDFYQIFNKTQIVCGEAKPHHKQSEFLFDWSLTASNSNDEPDQFLCF